MNRQRARRLNLTPKIFIVLLIIAVLPGYFVMVGPGLANAKNEEAAGRRKQREVAVQAGEPVARQDKTMEMLRQVLGGEIDDLEEIATDRGRREIHELAALLPRVDLDGARMLDRVSNCVQLEAPVLDLRTKAPSGDRARIRLVKEPETGSWKLDHIRVEAE